jgi:hypothetical protein
LSEITLTLVPWAPGTPVGAYPRHSEQMLPNQPPTGIPVEDTQPVAGDASLTFPNLGGGEYWAAAAFNGGWQYVAFTVDTEDVDAVAAIQSPDQRWHQLTVSDDGRLSTVDIGTSEPPHGPGPYVTQAEYQQGESSDDARLDAVESSVADIQTGTFAFPTLLAGTQSGGLSPLKLGGASDIGRIFGGGSANGILIYSTQGGAGTAGTIYVRDNTADDFTAIQINPKKDLVVADGFRQKITYNTPQTGWSGLANPVRPFQLAVSHLATDATPTQNVSHGIYSLVGFGQASGPAIAAVGSSHCFSAAHVVTNSGNAGNEHAAYFGYLRYDGNTTPGRAWFCDYGVHGAPGSQQQLLTGINMAITNYFNGSPSSAESYGIGVFTKPRTGAGMVPTAPHYSLDTYPIDNGIHVLGTSGPAANPTGAGFARGIKVGGAGSGWSIASSRFNVGIEIRDYDTYGMYIGHRHASAAAGAPALVVEAGAGPVIVGNTTQANASAIFEVQNAGTLDPMVAFRGTQAADSIGVRTQNATGGINMFIAGGSGAFIAGAAAGDGGIQPITTGKMLHFGGTTKVVTVTRDNKIGFFAVAPVLQQGAYTQTFSTAARTVNAYTGIATGVGATPYAQLTDLNLLRVAYENLRASHDNLMQVVNALIDDHQAYGLAA